MTMVYVPPNFGLGHPSYDVLAFTNTTDECFIYKYSGNDTSLEGLYYLYNKNRGLYWDRVEATADKIIGKSEQQGSKSAELSSERSGTVERSLKISVERKFRKFRNFENFFYHF